MSTVYFEIYRNDTMKLARSLVVKWDHCADAINTQLRIEGIEVDPVDPKSWKYYKHLAGEYHHTDKVMQVRSMDTLEIIDFTKENLALHRATAREYVPGTLYYNSLVDQFPDQTDLINGILYPIDIDTAINSHNGDILYFDPQYLDDNEDAVPVMLEDWIHLHYARWFNEQFMMTDDLYLATWLGQLYSFIPMILMVIRHNFARTRRANTFYIREWLASNLGLDEFLPYLNRKQQLDLYRNIRWYMRNAGKQSTWEELVEKICTERGIPLIRHEIVQNTEKMPGEIRPGVDILKHDVNIPVVHDGQDKTTVGAILDRELPLARDNWIIRPEHEGEIIERVSSDQYSRLQTKVLDSEVIDRSTSSIRSRVNVLFTQWVELSSRGKYRAYVQIPHPRTGELLTVTVKDALIMMLYAYIQFWEFPCVEIPPVAVLEALRSPLPNLEELRTYVSPRLVSDGVLTAIMDRIDPMVDYISTEQFHIDAQRFHTQYLRLWELYSFQQHKDARAQVENAVKANYMNRRCLLAPEHTKFDDYFAGLGIDIKGLRKGEYEQLVDSCFNIATGSNLYKVITMGDIQRELLKLMGRLSSYPLQYLRNVAYTNFTVLGRIGTRVGDVSSSAENQFDVNISVPTVQTYRSSAVQKFKISDAVLMPNIRPSYWQTAKFKVNIGVGIRDLSMTKQTYQIRKLGCSLRKFKIIDEPIVPDNGQLPHYQNSTDPDYPHA